MSESTLTPQTAPRSKDALLKESPFKLRILVQDLGGLATDDLKMAWHDLKTPEARAEYVLAMLTEWDKSRGGAPPATAPHTNGLMPGAQAAPAQVQAPMQQQPLYMPPGTLPGPSPQVAQVSPVAAAQATQATAEKSKRQPRTGGEGQASADLGADVLGMLAGIKTALETQNGGLSAFQQHIAGLLTEAISDKTSRVTLLEGKHGELTAAIQHLTGLAQGMANMQVWTIMLVLMFMQEHTGSGMVDVLRAAIDDSATFQKLVNQATSGKA